MTRNKKIHIGIDVVFLGMAAYCHFAAPLDLFWTFFCGFQTSDLVNSIFRKDI